MGFPVVDLVAAILCDRQKVLEEMPSEASESDRTQLDRRECVITVDCSMNVDRKQLQGALPRTSRLFTSHLRLMEQASKECCSAVSVQSVT